MRTYAVLMLAGLAAGCGTEKPTDPGRKDPTATAALIFRKDVEPSGANCDQGGTAVRVGLDLNGDGLLQDEEVNQTSYVCAAAEAQVLTRQRSEPAGSRCANGGAWVDTGRDADGDGALGDGEVSTSTCICAERHRVLSLVEAGDESCPFGGSLVESGIDLDDDGVLEAGEVTDSKHVCNRAGFAFKITSQDDLDLLAAATVVRGDLVVESETLEDVKIPFGKVLGSISVTNCPKLRSLNFDASAGSVAVGSIAVTYNPLLTLIDASLIRIAGDLIIAHDAALSSFTTRTFNVSEVDGSVRLDTNPSLMEVNLGLGRVGGLYVGGSPKLSTLRIGARTIDGGVWLEGPGKVAPAFEELRSIGRNLTVTQFDEVNLWAPSLVAVFGDVTLSKNGQVDLNGPTMLAVEGGLFFSGNGNKSFVVSGLQNIGGVINVWSNPALLALRLNGLRTASGLYVSGNPALYTCEVKALAAQLSLPPSAVDVSDTDDSGTCP